MKGKMQGVTLVADWDPKPNFKLGAKDIDGRQTYLGSLVYRNPRLEIREYDIPTPGPDEVLLQVKACGICGSDVHMAQADADGYIYYPGLTGFPCILGHELSGIVVEAGKNARDKRTNKPFQGGERVTTEEMLWCARCKPGRNWLQRQRRVCPVHRPARSRAVEPGAIGRLLQRG
jgi:threonine dehydrogenase-like Zn-dependent dehydrogenase